MSPPFFSQYSTMNAAAAMIEATVAGSIAIDVPPIFESAYIVSMCIVFCNTYVILHCKSFYRSGVRPAPAGPDSIRPIEMVRGAARSKIGEGASSPFDDDPSCAGGH